MEVNKQYLRHYMIFRCNLGKNVSAIHVLELADGENPTSDRTVRKWLTGFTEQNFNVEDGKCSEAPQKVLNDNIQSVLVENPEQTQKELAA